MWEHGGINVWKGHQDEEMGDQRWDFSIFELFMQGPKSWVELTPPGSGQLGRYSGEDLIRLNSSEFKNLASEASLRVANFTISVLSSSFNYHLFGIIIAHLICVLFLFIIIPKEGWDARKYIEKEEKRERERTRPKNRYLHELLHTENVKSVTIRLASGESNSPGSYHFCVRQFMYTIQ